jgi:ornithine cyclodeaminase/alanine dehydrogenase-like protein (mu-crystallin family)
MADTEKRKLMLINKVALDELVSLQDAIAIVDAAMRDYSAGQVGSPQRAVLTVNPATRMGLMPGTMPGLGRFGLKVVSLSSDAPKFGLYSHQGMMILFDDATGQPLCMVECHALTRLRTAAASAVATRALSRPDSKILTIIGNGDLAGPHIDAISAVRPIEQVIVWGRQPGKVEALVQSLPKVLNQTVKGPREVDDEVVARGYYIADSRPHVLSQGAEFCHAIEQGKVKEDHLKGEIGEVLAGSVPGRTSREQITIYKSLGHTAQDISVANAALSRAAESGKVVAMDW